MNDPTTMTTITTWQEYKNQAKDNYTNENYTQALISYQKALQKLQEEEEHQRQGNNSNDNSNSNSNNRHYQHESTRKVMEQQILLSNSVACRLKIGGLEMAVVAVEEAKKCINLNKKWAKAHIRLASAYIALGNNSNDACQSLQNAIRLDPSNKTARQMLMNELRRDYSNQAHSNNNNGGNSNNSNINHDYDHQQQQQQQQQAQSQQTHHRDHDTLYNTFIDNYRTGNHNMEMITGETSAKRNNNNGTENDSETFANVFGSSDDLKQLSLLFQQEEEKNTKTNYGGLKSIINNKTAIPSASFVCHAFDDDDAVDDKLKPLPRLVTNDSSISKRNENCALKYFTISISSLCQVPLSAYDIIDKVHLRSREVSTKYLPCVEFLVMCQQELRNAVAIATQHRKGYSAQQFYNQYFITLYQRFCRQNERRMPPEALAEASAGIKLLLSDVSKLIRKGSFEKMKNMFLGGMRDGESWGLRKWVSKHGGALKICNDLELIWGALRELPRDDESTKILAERLRPKMKKALERLVDEVPKAYQEISTAHPYLPFFHRLESVLKGLSEFDPEDDDVICLDMSDDEVQELKTPAKSTTTKLKSSVPNTGGTVSSLNQNEHKGYESDDSDIEIFCIKDVNGQRLDVGSTQATANNPRKPWTCNVCECPNSADERICTICDAKYDTLNNYEAEKKTSASSFSLNDTLRSASAIQLTQCIGGIVSEIESGNEKRFQTSPQLNPTAFWTRSDNYVVVLQIFQTLILENSTGYLLDFVAESPTDISRIIAILKNPLTFRDIAVALSDSESKGFLRSPLLKGSSTLKQWNLYEGKYLIEAIDLVFLNFLVLQGKTRSSARNSVEALHSLFWGKIKEAASYDNKLIPRRRREISEFVINKKQSAFKDDFG